jgi:hypothetical protein
MIQTSHCLQLQKQNSSKPLPSTSKTSLLSIQNPIKTLSFSISKIFLFNFKNILFSTSKTFFFNFKNKSQQIHLFNSKNKSNQNILSLDFKNKNPTSTFVQFKKQNSSKPLPSTSKTSLLSIPIKTFPPTTKKKNFKNKTKKAK